MSLDYLKRSRERRNMNKIWCPEKFCLEDKDEAERKSEFRFHKSDIPLLVDVLGLPEKASRVVLNILLPSFHYGNDLRLR